MIVEHEFITTREAADVLDSTRELLIELGFSPWGAQLVATRREYSRGRRNARQAIYRLDRQPQRVTVGFDRGRVTLAASIEPYGKRRDLHRELLVTLAALVEKRIVESTDLATLRARWEELHVLIRRDNRRRRLPRDLVLALVLLLVLGIVAATAGRW